MYSSKEIPSTEDLIAAELVASAFGENIPTHLVHFRERGLSTDTRGRVIRVYHYEVVSQAHKPEITVRKSESAIINWHLMKREGIDFVTSNLLPEHKELVVDTIGTFLPNNKGLVINAASFDNALFLLTRIWNDVKNYVKSKLEPDDPREERICAELFKYQFLPKKLSTSLLNREANVELILAGYSVERVQHLRGYVDKQTAKPLLTPEFIINNVLLEYPDEWLEEIIGMTHGEFFHVTKYYN